MFDGWTDEQLLDYESSLYEDEVKGEDTWELRDKVLWEMNRRGMMDRAAPGAQELASVDSHTGPGVLRRDGTN